MKNVGFTVDFAGLDWVMSPTSYRAAPPRTVADEENLNPFGTSVNKKQNRVAQSAHNARGDWDQLGDQA